MSSATARGLLHAMVVIGSAHAVRIAVGLAKAKLVAMLLGPAGLGLLSLLQNFKDVGVRCAGMGMETSGVREISKNRNRPSRLARVSKVMILSHSIQAVLAVLIIWALKDPLAEFVLNDSERQTEIVLIGVGVALALLLAARIALLQGFQRISALARTTAAGSVGGGVLGLLAVWFFGEPGLVWLVLAEPFVALLVARHFARRLPIAGQINTPPRILLRQWRAIVRKGLVFMTATLLSVGTLLTIRILCTQQIGLDQAGYFAAAWTLVATYVSFLLGTMSTDYFPRLATALGDPFAVSDLVNDQIQLAVIIGGPLLLVLIGCAPWIVPLMYSQAFSPAVPLLQALACGTVLKIASWPFGYVLMAAPRSLWFLLSETVFNAVFLSTVALALPHLGLMAISLAYPLAYAVYFAVVLLRSRREHGYTWQPRALRPLFLHSLLAFLVFALALATPAWGAATGVVLGTVTGLIGLRRLLSYAGTNGRLSTFIASVFDSVGWPIRNKP